MLFSYYRPTLVFPKARKPVWLTGRHVSDCPPELEKFFINACTMQAFLSNLD